MRVYTVSDSWDDGLPICIFPFLKYALSYAFLHEHQLVAAYDVEKPNPIAIWKYDLTLGGWLGESSETCPKCGYNMSIFQFTEGVVCKTIMCENWNKVILKENDQCEN